MKHTLATLPFAALALAGCNLLPNAKHNELVERFVAESARVCDPARTSLTPERARNALRDELGEASLESLHWHQLHNTVFCFDRTLNEGRTRNDSAAYYTEYGVMSLSEERSLTDEAITNISGRYEESVRFFNRDPANGRYDNGEFRFDPTVITCTEECDYNFRSENHTNPSYVITEELGLRSLRDPSTTISNRPFESLSQPPAAPPVVNNVLPELALAVIALAHGQPAPPRPAAETTAPAATP